MKRETVLVTGASSGIGRALAKLAAQDGHDLILVARSEGKLRELALELEQIHQTTATVIPMDLSEINAGERLYQAVKARGLQVDVLINNAGYGLYGSILETDPQDEEAMVRVNLVTLTDLTKRFTADMAARGYGQVLNLGSTAAFIPGPNMAVYYATKAYVLSLSEALNYELRPKGVTVTALCPGPVESGFQQRARVLRTDLDFVARTGYQAMRKGRPLVVPGWILWLMTVIPGFVPRRLMTALSAHIVRAAQ